MNDRYIPKRTWCNVLVWKPTEDDTGSSKPIVVKGATFAKASMLLLAELAARFGTAELCGINTALFAALGELDEEDQSKATHSDMSCPEEGFMLLHHTEPIEHSGEEMREPELPLTDQQRSEIRSAAYSALEFINNVDGDLEELDDELERLLPDIDPKMTQLESCVRYSIVASTYMAAIGRC